MNNNIYKEASKRKLRFTTGKGGQLSVEDLWDLSLKSLDEIAVALDSKTATSRKSFLENPDPKVSKAQSEDKLRLEILLSVIKDKQDENAAKRRILEKKAAKELLSNLMEEKKIESLKGMSIAELEARIAALDADEAPASESPQEAEAEQATIPS